MAGKEAGPEGFLPRFRGRRLPSCRPPAGSLCDCVAGPTPGPPFQAAQRRGPGPAPPAGSAHAEECRRSALLHLYIFRGPRTILFSVFSSGKWG